MCVLKSLINSRFFSYSSNILLYQCIIRIINSNTQSHCNVKSDQSQHSRLLVSADMSSDQEHVK